MAQWKDVGLANQRSLVRDSAEENVFQDIVGICEEGGGFARKVEMIVDVTLGDT